MFLWWSLSETFLYPNWFWALAFITQSSVSWLKVWTGYTYTKANHRKYCTLSKKYYGMHFIMLTVQDIPTILWVLTIFGGDIQHYKIKKNHNYTQNTHLHLHIPSRAHHLLYQRCVEMDLPFLVGLRWRPVPLVVPVVLERQGEGERLMEGYESMGLVPSDCEPFCRLLILFSVACTRKCNRDSKE